MIQHLHTASNQLLKKLHKRMLRLVKRLMLLSLRQWLLLGSSRLARPQGFVLPTTVLLLLVVTLAVGSMTLRTMSRTGQVIGERQQQVIYNAATPAIDRAKAKLEYLFNSQRDPRFPSGVPGEDTLYGMLINDGVTNNISQHLITNNNGASVDPYTFPDEEETATTFLGLGSTFDVDGNGRADRLDIDDDGNPDPAWAYRADTDGDGTNDATVAYSIALKTPNNPSQILDASDSGVASRANLQQVRHGPLSNTTELNGACAVNAAEDLILPVGGWFQDPSNASSLRKNMQVDVYVLPDEGQGAVSTMEFHQDRQVDQGNKWGAWFRNDLEIFPGPNFNWNGAMHTEGNLILGNNNFSAFLISSPSSCLYSPSSSEITVADIAANQANGIPEFQGQFMSGLVGKNDFGGGSKIHLHGTPPGIPGNKNFNKDQDSVKNSSDIATYALDPVRLLTDDVSQARGLADPSVNRLANWPTRPVVKQGRMYNQSQTAPYVDDSFRADNRYGPKARYKGVSIPNSIGNPIIGDLVSGASIIGNSELTQNTPPTPDNESNLGLDGYWERRARATGLRLIVGERLQLGNALGWGGGLGSDGSLVKADSYGTSGEEPLTPWSNCTVENGNNTGRCHETRQRRTLRDNLAAVQGTAIYHGNSTSGNDDFPVACLATVVHPGTLGTLIDSSTFRDLHSAIEPYLTEPVVANRSVFETKFDDASRADRLHAKDLIVSNFLTGAGTNGWEYEVPQESAFASNTSPLMVALHNLAYFAGDPFAGAPSFPPVDNATDTRVHPVPQMSMWGNYSTLRRVLAILDNASATEGNPYAGSGQVLKYADLSPADKTTLHTAACSLGMLAYNISYLEAMDYSKDTAVLQVLSNRLQSLESGTGLPSGVRTIDTNTEVSPEAFIAGLKEWNAKDADPNTGVSNQMIGVAEAVMLREQVIRDRMFGFKGGSDFFYSPNYSGPSKYGGKYAAVVDFVPLSSDSAYEGLRYLCTRYPKYPILHFLFPADFRGTSGSTPDGVIDANDAVIEGDNSRWGKRSSDDSEVAYIRDTLNTSITYQAIATADIVNGIALAPKSLQQWVLPHKVKSNLANEDDVNSNEDVLIGCQGAFCDASGTAKLVQVGFKDAALFNGREMLLTRVMDLQLDLLRQSNTGLSDDWWLPKSAIVYTYREDAVREDEITRPSGVGSGNLATAWTKCGKDKVFSDTTAEPTCYQNAGNETAEDSTDPPLDSSNRISPKPVDYHADPERRPYGFRLRNGSKVNRTGDEGRGLSFISDNPVYLMGDFNLHQTVGCNGSENCRIEEFKTKLSSNFGTNGNAYNFYTRTDLDDRFARPNTDLWRPSEILADGISILSSRFCDGSIEDGFLSANSGKNAQLNNTLVKNQYGCAGTNKRTSFLDQNRPKTRPLESTIVTGDKVRWRRENPYDPSSPILVSRNGNPYGADDRSYDGEFRPFKEDKPLINTGTNRVNAIIISGIVPSRPKQAYGGLHNFPRFLEKWNKLHISGAFLQLNFSNYATAPFDQDAWEPGTNPATSEYIRYYSPPKRLWGYDVALQYAPAGPVSSRFVTAQSIRSEFYSEPPADDPYMLNLCQQITNTPTQCGSE